MLAAAVAAAWAVALAPCIPDAAQFAAQSCAAVERSAADMPEAAWASPELQQQAQSSVPVARAERPRSEPAVHSSAQWAEPVEALPGGLEVEPLAASQRSEVQPVPTP